MQAWKAHAPATAAQPLWLGQVRAAAVSRCAGMRKRLTRRVIGAIYTFPQRSAKTILSKKFNIGGFLISLGLQPY